MRIEGKENWHKLIGKWVQRIDDDSRPFNSWFKCACLVTGIDLNDETIKFSHGVDHGYEYTNGLWLIGDIDSSFRFKILSIDEVARFFDEEVSRNNFLKKFKNQSAEIFEEPDETEEHLDLDLKLPNFNILDFD